MILCFDDFVNNEINLQLIRSIRSDALPADGGCPHPPSRLDDPMADRKPDQIAQ